MLSSNSAATAPATSPLARVEALIRALRGIAHARVDASEGQRITALSVVPSSALNRRQVERNISSALQAALGCQLEPGALRLVTETTPAGDDIVVPGKPS